MVFSFLIINSWYILIKRYKALSKCTKGMHNRMNKYFKVVYVFQIFLLLILVLTFSCKKRDVITRPADEKSDSVTESLENNTLVFGTSKAKSKPQAAANNNSQKLTVIDSLDIKGQLFPIESGDIIPDDMVIGPLLNFNRMNDSEASFSSAVITFFSDAEKGILNTETLDPLYSENIKKMFSDELDKQSYTLRIGRIVEDKGINSADIRLIGSIGRVSGTILADNLDGKCLLSDISINMKQLKKEYLKNQTEYDPLSYSNMLLNY